MKDWISGKNVLAGFGDPGGAKAILAALNLFGQYSASVRIVSSRKYEFFNEFCCNVETVLGFCLEKLFVNINCLIVGTSFPISLEIELIKIAKKLQIKSYGFVEHWVNFALRFETGNGLILPDVIGVVDQRARFQAIQEGLPANLIALVGNPYHEYLRNWKPTISEYNHFRSIGLELGESYVVFAPEPISTFSLKQKFGFDELCGLKAVIEALKKNTNKNLVLVVKAHPNQRKSYLVPEIIKNRNVKIIYVEKGDLNSLIFYSKAVIGFYSSALVEASILGKPILRLLYLANPGLPDSLAGQLNNNSQILNHQNQLDYAIRALI